MVANELESANWSTEPINFVSVVIHEPDLVSADAEEPLYAFSDRLSTVVAHVLAFVVAIVGGSVGITTGVTVVGIGHRVRVTTVTGGRKALKI